MKNLPRKRSYDSLILIFPFQEKQFYPTKPRHLSSHYRSFARRYKTSSFSIQDSRNKHPRLVSNVISPMVARDEWSNLYDTRDRVAFLAAPLVGVQFLKIVSHAHLDLSIILLNFITVHAFLYALLFFFSPTSERRGHLVPDTIIVPRSNFSSRQFFLSVSLLPYTRTARVS